MSIEGKSQSCILNKAENLNFFNYVSAFNLHSTRHSLAYTLRLNHMIHSEVVVVVAVPHYNEYMVMLILRRGNLFIPFSIHIVH